ncbi:MAG: hypothetical protein JOZ62_18155 [Acidobacteriaceae bacterium]|nr:hypothetical protein [Acidobacteriaceae bacterium]
MLCPECGFEIDEANESQPVPPQCGADPDHSASSEEQAPLADDLPYTPEPDLSLPDLDQAAADAAALREMDVEPVFHPGNDLLN